MNDCQQPQQQNAVDDQSEHLSSFHTETHRRQPENFGATCTEVLRLSIEPHRVRTRRRENGEIHFPRRQRVRMGGAPQGSGFRRQAEKKFNELCGGEVRMVGRTILSKTPSEFFGILNFGATCTEVVSRTSRFQKWNTQG